MRPSGSFWDRRRAGVRAEAEAEVRAAQERQDQARSEALAEKGDAEALSDLGLPDPTDMQAGDDFSAFMMREVPEHLRKRALRTLWRSNPVLACLDGLNDYDDDYRTAALNQGPVKTAYQVGRGMMRHLEEVERQELARKAAPNDPDEAGPDEAQLSEPEADVAPEMVAAATPRDAQPDADADPGVTEAAVSARRMRFHFGGDAA